MQLYYMRCSPDCPYEDCVITTTMPPFMKGGGGQGEEDGQPSDSPSSSGSASSGGKSSGGKGTSGQGKSGESGSDPMGNDGRSDEGNGGDDEKSKDSKRQQQGRSSSDSDSTPPEPPKQKPESKEDSGSGGQGDGDKPEPGKPEGSPESDGDGGKSDKDKSESGERDKPEPTPEPAESDEERREREEREQRQREAQEERDRRERERQERERQAEQQRLEKLAAHYKEIRDHGIDRYAAPGGYGASHSFAALPSVKSSIFEERVDRDRVFEARLKNVMVDNAYDRRVRGRKRGKLDMKSLYKVPAKCENVFTLKEARKNKCYNVLLLVDESGSMSGEKAELAAECAVFLAKSFEGINVNTSIVGFNQFVTTRKTWTSKADYDKIYEAIASMNYGCGHGDNNDWDGLNKSYQMFASAPKGQNILIMLSDGQPASSTPRFIDIQGKVEKPPAGTGKYTYSQRNDIQRIRTLVRENSKVAKSIGIGIFAGGQQIPHHTVIRDLRQLKPTIMKELQANIRRG